MNQLVRENLYYGENNSANSTYTYAYDSYGNMLGKYRYAYTTGSIANKLGITVAEYQYTDSQWGDLLTAVTDGTVSTVSKQNSTVSYDEMGNPTRYFGAAMTWAGKQLKYWGKSGKYVNFAYNEDGIRTLKNSNGVVTNYYYNGSLLIGMTVGSGSSTRILRFSYDSSGSVVAVDYSTDNGTTFNTYYYLRNAQNDIVKLIDSSGSTVVEYCYDSWGKPLSTSGSLASALGKDNPFRYRGYVFDEETGFYYLQSRYYNPEVGRFISSDVLLSTGQGVLGHNAYAYCGNNPASRIDTEGDLWDTLFDVVSLCLSVADVIAAPADPWAWAGLAGDVIDLIPFVTGVGEATKAVGATVKVINRVDDAVDTIKIVKAVDFTDDALDTIKTLDKVNGATKSSLSAGRRIHRGYKAGDDILYGISKEVTRNRARADFVDEANKIIYESKPNNPRGLRQGIKQLQRYRVEFGKEYGLVLELY